MLREDAPTVREDAPTVREDAPTVREDAPTVREDAPMLRGNPSNLAGMAIRRFHKAFWPAICPNNVKQVKKKSTATPLPALLGLVLPAAFTTTSLRLSCCAGNNTAELCLPIMFSIIDTVMVFVYNTER
jgi:hypothetical protein